jgi:uncharacterized protein involved in exopolysaccharide biosynthesis/Mrp family chromosome partitioning ATPase
LAKYDINLRDYWRIIRKRRGIVILATLLFVVFSYLFALFRAPAPLYRTASAVKVEKAADLTTLLLDTVAWTTWDNVATQAVIITSFPIMERAAKEMKLIPTGISSAEVRSSRKYLRTVNGLKSQVVAEQEGNTNIINVTATSTTPTKAALVANTVAEVFRQANMEERNKKVRDTREFIEKQLQVVKGRLQEAEEELRTFEETTKLVALDAQTSAALELLTNLKDEVAQLQKQRLQVIGQLDSLEKVIQGKQLDQGGVYLEDPPPVLANLIHKFGDLSLRRKVLLNDYTKDHPEVKVLDAELQNVTSEMDRELQSMLAAMDGQLNELETRLSAAQAQTMTIPAGALKLARLRREVDVNAELYAQLKSKHQEALIQESGLVEEVKIIKPALEPSQPVNTSSTTMNTVTGGLIGLVVGLVLALIVETMDTSLGTIEDVEEVLNIPVLGVIPSTDKLSSKERGREEDKVESERLVTHFAPRSPVAEAYRSLRTSLQFIRMDKKAKVFLITSSSLQEGKTHTVVNLSLSLAQAGEKVLLIDADLRRPMIHRIFGTQRQPGLSEYIMDEFALSSRGKDPSGQWMSELIVPGQGGNGWKNVVNTITDIMLGEFEIDDILRTPGLDNLHLINAGASPISPAEILRSAQFKELLHKIRDQYDIIIIDTPPVLPVADAFEVAPEVDGVVLVYEVGRIGRGILNRAKIQLENLKANVLGVILNNVKPDVSPDIYSYSSVHYYREEGANEVPPTPSRWRKLMGQPMGWLSNKIRHTTTIERRR